ncbi:hypothetical protein AFK68_01085 [Hydrocoleum sp. CS-953]|nr:hypothetical protein AFK68_01085 [Hydrocoleum sp. CS-953]
MKRELKYFNPKFQPSQIVCLEHGNTCLYAEVIQVLEARQMCWVRPWILKVFSSESECENNQDVSEISRLWDLRDGADLVWPICLFREVIDTEFLPLLSELYLLDSEPKNLHISHQHLRDFVREVWRAFPDVFPLVQD